MNLAKDLLHQIGDPNLSYNERAQVRCKLSRQLEEAGNYEAAKDAIGELWQTVGETPVLEGLDEQTKAEVLLRAGVLTGWLGSTKQVNGAQETAKNLISASIAIFEGLHETKRVTEANIELAVCYWREGAFDEARVTLAQAIETLDENDGDLKALALIRSAVVEKADNRLLDALRILNDATPFLGTSTNNTLRGKFHNDLGMVLKNLWVGQSQAGYVDRALIEFAAASFYFEQAGHARYQAYVENNLGFLFCNIGEFRKAHEHLDRAQMLFTSLKDSVHLAQVDETRARVMLSEGRIVEAEKTAHRAVRTFEKGDEQSLLAEALITHGISLARLGHHEQARPTLERASDVAQQAGDPESAGQAALVIIEELDAYLSNDDLKATVERARELLKNTQDMSTLRRLGACACLAVSIVHASARFPSSVDWTNFSIEGEWLRDEAHFIKLALKDSTGSVTRAARLLGLPSHQALVWKLNRRHPDLLTARRPAKQRRRSIIRHDDAAGAPRKKTSRKARALRILHVEDDSVVANMMKETLALEGWEVEICADGTAAMAKITSHTHYDLLLLDYDLPGMNGVELVQQARSLVHRRAIPIIILSATLDEAAANMAGADASLRKPEDISAVAETIARLLRSAKD